MFDTKKQLRQKFLAQRQTLSQQDWQTRSLQIVEHLAHCSWFLQAETVFAYRSFRHEVQLDRLFDMAVLSHRWAFPRCDGKILHWHQWRNQSADAFQTSSLGIEEPQIDWPRLETPDLILVPTVACDRRGFRLGYGGGFYDRMLADLQRRSVRTIGIVYQACIVDRLPIDDWDIPLDAICCETGITYCSAD